MSPEKAHMLRCFTKRAHAFQPNDDGLSSKRLHKLFGTIQSIFSLALNTSCKIELKKDFPCFNNRMCCHENENFN